MKNIVLGLLALVTIVTAQNIDAIDPAPAPDTTVEETSVDFPDVPKLPPAPVVEEEESVPPASTVEEKETSFVPPINPPSGDQAPLMMALFLEKLEKQQKQNEEIIAELRKERDNLMAELGRLREERETSVEPTEIEPAPPKATVLLHERDPKELRLHEGSDRSENYTMNDPGMSKEIVKVRITEDTEYVIGPRQIFKTTVGPIERRPVLYRDSGLMVVAKGKTPEVKGMTLEPIHLSVTDQEGKVNFIPFWMVAE